MSVTILRGDARNLPLPDACVDLIVTSPPYWQLRSYSDNGEHYSGQIGSEPTVQEYLDNLLDCTREWMRVLKPTGNLFINLGDKYGRGTRTTIHGGNSKSSYVDAGRPGYCAPTGNDKSLLGLPWRYALACTDELGLILRRDIIWAKPNGLPESVTDRCRSSHEYLFHLTVQPRYYAAVDEIREPHAAASLDRYRYSDSARMGSLVNHDDDSRIGRHQKTNPLGNPLGKLPGSVWEIPASPLKVPDWVGIDHFAAYPPELCRRIILGWSPKEGTCLDPFGGTGTTAMTADVLGRNAISVDMSADYCKLASWRTHDPVERAKVLKEKLSRSQLPARDQPSLFEEE